MRVVPILKQNANQISEIMGRCLGMVLSEMDIRQYVCKSDSLSSITGC